MSSKLLVDWTPIEVWALWAQLAHWCDRGALCVIWQGKARRVEGAEAQLEQQGGRVRTMGGWEDKPYVAPHAALVLDGERIEMSPTRKLWACVMEVG